MYIIKVYFVYIFYVQSRIFLVYFLPKTVVYLLQNEYLLETKQILNCFVIYKISVVREIHSGLVKK